MPDLLSEALRQRLMPLRLRPRKARSGGPKGERRSVRRGTSLEFADFRSYTAGDDLRKLDWNAYARLDRPIIKLYEDEQDAIVHVLIDDSASMGSLPDDPASHSKGLAARQMAAGLGFIALHGGDRLTLTRLSQPQEALFSGRGRGAISGLLRALEALTPGGAVDGLSAMRQFSQRERRSGMVSATARANPISCVTTIMVMPLSASSTITSSTSLIISGSRADVGSSKSMIFGCIARARAMATRCC
jgi:uncharacterized protein (DUF58 family)